MTAPQFSIDPDEGFYVTIADDVTVYAAYDAAVAELQAKLAGDADGFLATVAIEQGGPDDVAVTLEQVSWQRIIRDLPADDATDPAHATAAGTASEPADTPRTDSGPTDDA
jgi:hypothetical protein